jgi:hypothetical protein
VVSALDHRARLLFVLQATPASAGYYTLAGSERHPMRPGQIKPNEFELAIFERFASRDASIRASIDQLHVLSSEFTGVGSFTNFACEEASSGASEHQLTLDALIEMPGAPNGMGAVLFCKETGRSVWKCSPMPMTTGKACTMASQLNRPPNRPLQPASGEQIEQSEQRVRRSRLSGTT